jgi:hypothetical protein
MMLYLARVRVAALDGDLLITEVPQVRVLVRLGRLPLEKLS